MTPPEINWLAVIAAALSSFIIGGLWYSPILFSRPWVELNGLDEAELRARPMGKIFAVAFLLELIMAANLAAFLGKSATIAFGAFAGLAAGLGWVALGLGVTYLFEQRPFKLLLINGGYHAVAFLVMGVILGAWH